MGKKGSWFSAIKRVFIPSSKEKLVRGSEKKDNDKKKRVLGKLRSGDGSSFIPHFREPSSIEKILGEAEAEQQKAIVRPPTPSEQKAQPFVQTQAQAQAQAQAQTPPQTQPFLPRVASPKLASPRLVHHSREGSHRSAPTLWNHHVAATRIQTAFRGYKARRSFRALRGLVRLQGVVRGQNVKRQAMNAMKYMQLLVRVQSQIRTRRIQMLEAQALQRQALMNDKDVESTLGKGSMSQISEAGNQDDWDDSLLSKEEIEARLQRKVEATLKRERAMAYAYSHQLWNPSPTAAQSAAMDFRAGGFPWWWNWIERQLPPIDPHTQSIKNTDPRTLAAAPKQSPQSHHTPNHRQPSFGLDQFNPPTPRSSQSPLPPKMKLMQQSPSPLNRFPQSQSPRFSKYSKARASADSTFGDDDSLVSCPPFSVPNYMSPTMSAKAKAKAGGSYSKAASPSEEPKRRLSYPLTPGVGSFKWGKGSPLSTRDSPSQRGQAGVNLSVDSSASLPVGLGRKPFNRFV